MSDKMKQKFLLDEEECFYQSVCDLMKARQKHGIKWFFKTVFKNVAKHSLSASYLTKINHHHHLLHQAGYDAGLQVKRLHRYFSVQHCHLTERVQFRKITSCLDNLAAESSLISFKLSEIDLSCCRVSRKEKKQRTTCPHVFTLNKFVSADTV